MSATAVTPMQTPTSTRRRSGSAIAARSGDAGCSTSIVQRPADTMNAPSAHASIRYSGQLRRSFVSIALAPRLEAGIERHAAVHEQADAVHVVGVVRREPYRRAADLFGLADALVGDELQELVV